MAQLQSMDGVAVILDALAEVEGDKVSNHFGKKLSCLMMKMLLSLIIHLNAGKRQDEVTVVGAQGGQGRGRKIISSSEISEDDMDVSIIDNPRPSVSNIHTMKHSGDGGQKYPRKPPTDVYTSDDDDGMNTNGRVADEDEDNVSPTEAVQLPNMLVTPRGVDQGTWGTDCG